MNVRLRHFIFFISVIFVVGIFVGCKANQISTEDILTQKKTDSDRMQISVLIKYAFSINAFEEAVEKQFPNVDIVQVGNFTTALDPAEYEARMEHDDLSDIIMTWPLSFGKEYWEDRLIDLSSMPFTSRYHISMLNSISEEGKLYYLPGPAQIRGIVYNKTLFQEKGWQIPNNYEEFIDLCKNIEDSGIRSIQLGFENPEVLDTAFAGYGFADAFATPKDLQWISNYAKGDGDFLDHFEQALNTFQEMIHANIWQKADLEIDYSEREKMFFNRECAMIEDSVLMARSALQKTGSTDEFALMPFFNPGGKDSDWARLYMVCYLGLNKHLEESQNKEKYDVVMKIMEYISTPEGQEVLSADTGAMYSSLKGVSPPNVVEIQDLISTLENGRYAIFQELSKVQSTLREGLAGMVSGELTKEDVAKMVDEANETAAVQINKSKVLGRATEDFTIMETGNFITDVMREVGESEIALFLDGGKDGRYNNKGVTARLYNGEVTTTDIKRIMPDFQYGELGELWEVTMTGESLLETLEYAIAVDNDNTGWFYYFSGIKVCYDATAEPGSRIKTISMIDGKEIEADNVYTITVTENSVSEEKLLSCEKTGVYLNDILTNAIIERKTIEPSADGRFTVPE